MVNEEETEAYKFLEEVVNDIWNVISANHEQGKITEKQWLDATGLVVYAFPTKEVFESGKSSLAPDFSKSDVVSRLQILAEDFPFLIGVYKKYDAKVDRPVICLNCGSELPRTARFCPDCGTQVTPPEE